MSYFAAVLARNDDGWVAGELDLDEVETLEDIADAARDVAAEAGGDDEMLLVLVEQADEWFGVVRIELDEDPRAFVSDAAAALRHALGETLLPDLVPEPVEPDVLEVLDADELETADKEDADVHGVVIGRGDLVEPSPPTGPAGDASVLEDLGVRPGELVSLAGSARLSPGEALADLAERLGCEDVLDAVR